VAGQGTSGMEEDCIGNRSPRRTVASALGEKNKKVHATQS
jgi:hypothetical protein